MTTPLVLAFRGMTPAPALRAEIDRKLRAIVPLLSSFAAVEVTVSRRHADQHLQVFHVDLVLTGADGRRASCSGMRSVVVGIPAEALTGPIARDAYERTQETPPKRSDDTLIVRRRSHPRHPAQAA